MLDLPWRGEVDCQYEIVMIHFVCPLILKYGQRVSKTT